MSLQALDLLNGVWRLVYTANSELLALLALNELPGVRVGDIVQEVERGLSVSNKVHLDHRVCYRDERSETGWRLLMY